MNGLRSDHSVVVFSGQDTYLWGKRGGLVLETKDNLIVNHPGTNLMGC